MSINPLSVNPLTKARGTLSQLVADYQAGSQHAVGVTDRLAALLNSFPQLVDDMQAIDSLCSLVERIYSKKDRMPTDKQSEITSLFQRVHHLTPTFIDKLGPEPTCQLVKQIRKPCALYANEQDYSVPYAILAEEMTPSQDYFATLELKLGDGSTVKISQGFLTRFSDMARLAQARVEMQRPVVLVLDQLNRHQCDVLIAFLETSKETLIHEDNALALMHAASYLQIPSLLEACTERLFLEGDPKGIVQILNNGHEKKQQAMIHSLEKKLSKALLEPDFPLGYYKEHLIYPICVDLSGSDVTDAAVRRLEGLNIRELYLMACPKLTKKCLTHLAKILSLRTLKLGGNGWVDDQALGMIPKGIATLSLLGCTSFTKQGLINLSTSNVLELELFGCSQLQDDDLAEVPVKLTGLDLRMCQTVGPTLTKKLSEMSALRRLVLADAKIGELVLPSLPKGLHFLDLSGVDLFNSSVTALTQMEQLEELWLCHCLLNDSHLRDISQHARILRLDGCMNVTDAGLVQLLKPSNLRLIGLYDCPKITRAGVDRFARSHITIEWQEPQASHIASTLH